MRLKLLSLVLLLASCFVFAGEHVSLNFPNPIPLDTVFKMIARSAQVNILLTKSVKGITAPSIILKNIYFEKAFEIIAKTYGLSYRKIGANTYIIGKPDELAKTFDVGLTKIFKLRYADPNKVKAILTEVFKGSGGAANLIKVAVDSLNNALIVSATQNLLDSVEDLIRRIDKPVKQVLIEVKMIQVLSKYSSTLGFEWTQEGAKSPWVFTLKYAEKFIEPIASGDGITGEPGVGYPILKFGEYVRNGALNWNITNAFTESVNGGKSLVNTRMILLNGQEGELQMGRKIIYEIGQGDNRTGAEKDADIILKVKPIINDEGYVTLHLEPDFNIYLGKDPMWGFPLIEKKKLTLDVRVKDGEEVMIGGMIDSQTSHGSAGFKFLKDLPLIGRLFRKEDRAKDTRQIIFLLKVHILDNEA